MVGDTEGQLHSAHCASLTQETEGQKASSRLTLNLLASIWMEDEATIHVITVLHIKDDLKGRSRCGKSKGDKEGELS